LGLTLIASVSGAAVNVDYKKNGDDWGVKFATCKSGTQSPIDLKTNADKVNANTEESFFKFYPNIKNTQVLWKSDSSTNYVAVDELAGKHSNKETPNAYFESKFGNVVFGGPKRW